MAQHGEKVPEGSVILLLDGSANRDERGFPDWEVDWDHAEQARTSTGRGWEKLPVPTP